MSIGPNNSARAIYEDFVKRWGPPMLKDNPSERITIEGVGIRAWKPRYHAIMTRSLETKTEKPSSITTAITSTTQAMPSVSFPTFKDLAAFGFTGIGTSFPSANSVAPLSKKTND